MATPSVSQMTLSNGSNKVQYSNGTFIVNNDVRKDIKFQSIICLGAVKISDLRHVGSATDVKAQYLADPTKAHVNGTVITAKAGFKFSSITTDGSAPVILVL